MKPWYQSKTLWFNALGACMAGAQYLSGIHAVPDAALVPAMAAGNAILRFLTTQPIGSPAEAPKSLPLEAPKP